MKLTASKNGRHLLEKYDYFTFRKAFLELVNVRSLLPEHVRVMALTATATMETRKAVCRLLGIVNPVVILEVPDHPNIKNIVRALVESMEDTFAPLVDEIRQMRLNMLSYI